MRLSRICLLAAVSLALVGQAFATPVFSLPTPGAFRNDSWSFGEIFTVGPQNLTVTALGAWDDGGNGFVSQGGIPVGIFRESDSLLLASTFVQSSDPLVDGFRYGTITPLVLLSGTSYRVVAVNLDDNYNINLSYTVDPAITRTGYGYCQATSLTSCGAFTGTERIWMANFDFAEGGAQIPEPVTSALAGAGLLGLALLRRRRSA